MGNPLRRYLYGIVVFAVVLIAFGGLSYAQEAAEEEQPGVPEETVELPISVGEITVTGRGASLSAVNRRRMSSW